MSEKREPQLGCTAVVMPCPFCGGEDPKIVWSGAYPYMVRCVCGCEFVMDAKITEEMAWAVWNMRLGDRCRLGCKITRAVQEMNDSLTSNY